MTVFNIEITNESHLAGITAARNKYNENLPLTITEEGNEIPNPALITTDEDYVQFVMSKAAESYANQYGT
jgi:hypothetical protein